MRKAFLIACFAFIAAAAFGQVRIQNGLYFGRNTFMNFSSNNQLEAWDVNFNEGYDDPNSLHLFPKRNNRSGTFTVNNESGIDYITVRWANGTSERYLLLLLANEGVVLYRADSEPLFVGTRYYPEAGRYGRSMADNLMSGNSRWITASSTLTEGRVRYSTDNLGIKIGECWVEGVEGYGIGETLTLNLMQISNIYISSGFVSFSRPHLFWENTRIRKIKVTNEAGESEIILLEDTPHFQELKLTTTRTYIGRIILEIVEVYPGTKFSDTCVNSILGLFSQ